MGSMPIASAAWSTAQAAAWAGGPSATITFGGYLTSVTPPGEPPARVRLFDDEGDTAGFPLAVDALDGALDLANPRAGARLLVVVSDGELAVEEKRRAEAHRSAATGGLRAALARPAQLPR